ncbi:MAG TPA: radical SAM protein [Candidatus Sabulitectum sp.]|nr:radical SAM protein [Candidatus Sabulitectum sp.]HPJ28112.1 radical SAM protein [Candidatus Sabulitectum sp.]HPR22090.1 radical SAM protein [Candidatus Sabulitectum sp.]
MNDAPYWVSPREANLLITGRCNLRCRHCSVLSHGPLKEDLPLGDWERILDKLARNRLIKLTLTGGEPMAREDFPEFLEAVAERPFRFSVNTNGTLITPGVIESLVKHRGRLNDIMVSLDGPDAATVDSQRGEGVFDKLVLGVTKLRTAGLPFGFYCTVTSLNVDRLVETADLAMRTGAGWIKFNNFMLAGPDLGVSMIPAPEQISKAASDLMAMEATKQGLISGTIIDMRKRALDYLDGNLRKTEGNAFACGGGRVKIAVFPNGDVSPCDHIPDLILGNILHSQLEDILNGPGMNEFTSILNGKRNRNPRCRSCEYLDFCSGGCPVEAINTGDLNAIDRLSCLKIALENMND